MTETPPTEVWLGKTDGQWPVHIFTAEAHAICWLREPPPRERRRVWAARVVLGDELILMQPEPYLAPARPAGGGTDG
jgi:hypothetical protein